MADLIQTKLNDQKLDMLKSNTISGVYEEQRKQKIQQLSLLIENALFLEKDEERKRKWLRILDELDDEFLEKLMTAVIRENLRYKKKERDIVIELNKKIPTPSFQK
ncbi:hypothetical protein HZA38_00575 [Candidatus Peregrinibacteria bacterium]|nr:hypothetical protein [Candidatus Peregrinibacteria bacterium]